jgi:glycosyltransferase involved in cell wall biosynthesis
MLVNLTFPVFNEEAQLAVSLRRVTRFLATQPQHAWELVVADNGSSDRTLDEARAFAAEGVVPLRIRHRDKPGRGGALREAWLGSDAAVLSYMDIDLSTDLAHLPELVGVVARGDADLAIGSRLSPDSQTTRGWRRELLSRSYNCLLRGTLALEVRDAQCGFKALSRAAAQALLPQVRDDGFFFDTELLVLAQRRGWRIGELPVRWVDDPDTRVRIIRTIWRDLRGVCRMVLT